MSLGVRRASDLALPAFLSSAYGALAGVSALLPEWSIDKYRDVDSATSKWEETLNNNCLQPPIPALQASWDLPICSKKYNDLLSDQTIPAERARLLAVASENSSDWLHALPVPALGLKLDDTSMRIACGLRLGAPLCQPYKCMCGSLVDSSGRHGLSCKNAKGTFPRHQQINDLIKRAMGSAQVSAVLEPPGLCRSDGKRPDGLSLFPWSQGKCLVWDFTCRDTLAPSNVPLTSQEAGKAAVKAQTDKMSHYQELSLNYIIQPVAVETLGSWGPDSLSFVRQIGQRIADNIGDKRSTSYLLQAISMAIQRGNVTSIRGSVPNTKYLHELFYL